MQLYLVKTDEWYVERAVWCTAGTLAFAGSLLAWLASPLWLMLIGFIGLSSITVSLTGFCLVGNAYFFLFGLRPRLKDTRRAEQFYRMQTDRWYLERYIYLFVGINLSITSLLARIHTAKWLFFTSFVGSASIFFALSGFCIMAHLLYRLGAEPRLKDEFRMRSAGERTEVTRI